MFMFLKCGPEVPGGLQGDSVCVDGTESDTGLTTVAPFPILNVKSSHYFKKAGLKRETKKKSITFQIECLQLYAL